MTLRNSNRTTLIAVAAIGLAILIRLALSWTSLELLPATSDEAANVLWAKRISEGLRPLLWIAQPYQFPIEAYVQSLLVEWVPRNALGARYLALLLGWIATAGLVLIAYRMFDKGRRWPALLLILFPSAYWLQHQAGYTPPQYAMSAVLTITLFYAVVRAHYSNRNMGWFFLAGLAGGLSVSNHLVGVAGLVSAIIVLLFTASKHHRITVYAALAAGTLIGLSPYFAAIATIPGAYQSVDGSVSIMRAIQRIINFAATETVPGVMGIKPTLFPDIEASTGWGSDLRQLFSAFYYGMLFTVVVHRLSRLWVQIRIDRKINSHPVDVFILSSFASIVLFALSDKAGLHLYRFILILVWCFPFIAGYFINIVRDTRWFKPSLVAIFLYATINIITTLHMVVLWRSEETRLDILAQTRDLTPILEYLQDNGHQHCYATYWTAYRINWVTDENIICAQPYNERFPGYGVPYKKEVDAQPNTPVFAMMSNRTHLKSYSFMLHMKHSNIAIKHTRIGDGFDLFTHFTHLKFSGNVRHQVPSDRYDVYFDNTATKAIEALADNHTETSWTSTANQSKDMRLVVRFDEPTEIHEIKLSYQGRHHDVPVQIDVMDTSTAGAPKRLTSSKHDWEGIIYEQQKPVYRGNYHPIWLDAPTTVSSIELIITEPRNGRPWVLSDILFATGG